MKFTCNKESLEEVLKIVMRVVSPTATLEALQGVKILVDNNTLILRATNLEIGIETTIPCVDSENGSLLIHPRILLETIKYSHSKNITVQKTDKKININLESGNTTIRALDDVDFPNIPKYENVELITIKNKKFLQGLHSVLYAISRSVIKPELASAYIWQDDKDLVFVATDSFRLAEKRVPQTFTTINDIATLIPYKNTQDIVAILEQINEDEQLELNIDTEQMSLRVKNTYITVRTIDGVFPDYQKIIPKDPVTEVTLLKKDLTQTLRKATVFTDTFNKVTIQVSKTDKSFTISTSNKNIGDTKDSITCVIEGIDSEVSINYQYITEALSSITGDSLIMSFFGQGKPIILRGIGDASFLYLVMPMNQ